MLQGVFKYNDCICRANGPNSGITKSGTEISNGNYSELIVYDKLTRETKRDVPSNTQTSQPATETTQGCVTPSLQPMEYEVVYNNAVNRQQENGTGIKISDVP